MKSLVLGGVSLAALGLLVLLIAPSYRSQQSTMRIGGMAVSAESQRSVPPWVGWIAIVGGVALFGAGVARRPAS
jgi:hypothetical protein